MMQANFKEYLSGERWGEERFLMVRWWFTNPPVAIWRIAEVKVKGSNFKLRSGRKVRCRWKEHCLTLFRPADYLKMLRFLALTIFLSKEWDEEFQSYAMSTKNVFKISLAILFFCHLIPRGEVTQFLRLQKTVMVGRTDGRTDGITDERTYG